MRKAVRAVAASLGFLAGFGGPEHGIFEIMQGHVRPDGLMIASIGPPCDPEQVWNLCEPALTVVPSFLITGILATIVGILTMVWAIAFVHKKPIYGPVLIGLSIALLLVGGGLFPPIIGIVGGVVAIFIHASPRREPGSQHGPVSRFFAALWPWPLVAFFTWLFGQFVIGYFFNDLLMASGYVVPLMILGLMALSIVSGFARDAQRAAG
jgi:hypothetical protein